MPISETHDKGSKVLRWTLDQPGSRNAFGFELIEKFTEFLNNLEEECHSFFEKNKSPDINKRILHIRANTDQISHTPTWMSGGHLKDHQKCIPKKDGRSYAEAVGKICLRLEQLPIPVLISIDGKVIGGAIEFILSGDIRLASEQSSFMFKQLDLGLSTGFGGSHRLRETIGRSKAFELLLLSKKIDAKEALRLGIIHNCFTKNTDTEKEVELMARHICQLEARTVAAQKKMLRKTSYEQGLAILNSELEIFEKLWMNPSHTKALEAFKNKKLDKNIK